MNLCELPQKLMESCLWTALLLDLATSDRGVKSQVSSDPDGAAGPFHIRLHRGCVPFQRSPYLFRNSKHQVRTGTLPVC